MILQCGEPAKKAATTITDPKPTLDIQAVSLGQIQIAVIDRQFETVA